VVSTLIGLGRLWPGSGPDRSTAARVVLLGLNVLAVVAPLTFTGDGSQQHFYASAARAVPVRIPSDQPARLQHGRDVVRNIYAYDAAGQPLQGVQLFDQQGRPISVAPQSSMGRGKDARSPARGSTGPRRCSTSSRCPSGPRRAAPACAMSTRARWVRKDSTNPRWRRSRRPPGP
jgi:hypothetical protein